MLVTIGNLIVKVEPPPSWLSTNISPPSRCKIEWEIYNPKPVPTPTSLVVKKGEKMWGKSFSGMPSPVSLILISALLYKALS